MQTNLRPLFWLAFALALARPADGGDWTDLFRRKAATPTNAAAQAALAGLSRDQVAAGLKEAIGAGVQRAVATLGQPDGFLNDVNVRIPMPEGLSKLEQTLRRLKQDRMADEFVTTLNRAAEQAVPEAAGVLGDAVRQMTVADAKSILVGTNNAATQYFRQTSGTNLYARFLPIVRSATAQTGVTAAYKRMTDLAGAKLGGFGSLAGVGSGWLAKDPPDLDAYVTEKALDGLFLKIAEQERLIRENPVARGSELLQKVFGAVAKPPPTR